MDRQLSLAWSPLSAADQAASAFDDAPVGVALTAPYGEVLRANRALAALLGLEPDALPGVSLLDLVHEQDRASALSAWEALHTRGERATTVEARLLPVRGDPLPVQVTSSLVRGSGGRPSHLVVHVEPIPERLAARAQLQHLALHDELTGLPNRTLLADRLAQVVAELGRDAERAPGAALLFLDLDRFKQVNDSLGHGAGDDLLRQLAARLRSLLRPGDTAARLSGDEFTVLCRGVDAAQAAGVAERVRRAVAEPFVLDGRFAQVSGSIGVVGVAAGDSPDRLLRDADTAMYAAKQRGRDRTATFSPDMQREAEQRLRTEEELRRALVDDALTLHYQPVRDLRSGRVVGLEALVRWPHPQRGLLLPAQFVPLGERSALGEELGRWVLEAAAQQAARWRQAGPRPPVVWVNVGPRQLGHGLVQLVRRLREQYDLPPGALGLEVAERLVVADAETLLPLLADLREAGARLALDDVGAGLSSLRDLARLPVDVLKLDRSCLTGDGPDRPRPVLAAVLALAGAVGLETVVEGVEHAAELELLRAHGAPAAQGFHLGAPQPAELAWP